MSHTYAIDFESFYSKDVSISLQGIHHYLRHPEQDIYLVSIAGTDGTRYVGHPKDAPWDIVCANKPTFLAHNVGFDFPVFLRLQELGIAPAFVELTAWHDTADMTAFLGYPRSLKEASFYLLGKEISKDTRDKMKGQRWETMTPEFQEETLQYAMADAENCLQIWLDHSHKWPAHEREISKMTREMAYLGVPLDRDSLENAKNALADAVWQAEALVPWAKESPILSPLAVQAECLKVGIEFPGSLAQGDPDAIAWEEKYAETYPWIKAIRSYRKANKNLKTVETMLSRLRMEGVHEGTMAYGLKAYGAHTGRDSGDAGINLQNFPKAEIAGVNLRGLIQAPEGYTLVIADLSQIEPRCLHWLAGDTKMLDLMRQSSDFYDAQARGMGLWNSPEPLRTDPKMRHLVKCLNLGLGYGLGAKKFKDLAGLDSTEADRLVALYRGKNPLVTKLWRRMEDNLRKTAMTAGDRHAEIELPSGRKITYRNVSTSHGGLTVEIPRNGKMMRVGTWGGSLVENATQGMARDVFMQGILTMYREGLKCIMRVHDEAVLCVPEENAERDLKRVIEIMSTPPEWASDLPLAAEGCISKVYKK